MADYLIMDTACTHNARVSWLPVVERTHTASRPLFARHSDQADICGVWTTVVAVGNNRVACGACLPANSNTSAGQDRPFAAGCSKQSYNPCAPHFCCVCQDVLYEKQILAPKR
eukprot:TRINITY_DN65688_c0_g1_i1.p1 TRINITY_DN65688_c0_g1~~TRINITY_DN65688_c0_g1_i1.p1  ORF type:complete len:121 (-),score=5.00 TRINITY_DN65688_c0_g1_i1:8-346(-)